MTCTHNGTVVEYNNIEIKDVLTEGIDQQVVYDSSNVDPIGIRVRVSIVGYVCITQQDKLGLQITGPTTGFAMIRRQLVMPRRPFKMTVGEDTLFDVRPSAVEWCSTNKGYDTNDPTKWEISNGPKPSCNVLAIIGQEAYKISFQVEFTIQHGDCSTFREYAGILSLRFWISDDIDTTSWITTRTYAGRLRVKSRKYHPHQVGRLFAIPPLQQGFQRQTVQLREAPSGLELDFAIVDKEVHAAPPAPATDWEGHYEVVIPFMNITCEAECRVRLTGAPVTPKTDLLILAAKILDTKLNLRVGLTRSKERQLLLGASFREDLKNNTVEAYARVKYVQSVNQTRLLNLADPGPDFSFGKPLDKVKLGLTPPYNWKRFYYPGVSPGSLAGLFMCSLQTPCCPVWFSATTVSPAPKQVPEDHDKVGYEDDGDPLDVTLGPLPPADPVDRHSQSHKDKPYLDVKMTSRIIGNTGMAMFPMARIANDRSSAAVKMTAPQQRRIITIQSSRLNQWPEVSDFRTNWTDSNKIEHTLIDYKFVPAGSQMSADGKADVQSVRMELVYALSRPIDPTTDKVLPGRLPYRAADETDFQEITGSNIFVDPKSLFDVSSST